MSYIEKRKHRRVADALAMSISTKDLVPTALKIHVVSLSIGGLGLTSSVKLDKNQEVILTVRLGPSDSTIELRAETAECTKISVTCQERCYATRFIFKNVDVDTRLLLEQHIDYVYQQTRVLKELPYRHRQQQSA